MLNAPAPSILRGLVRIWIGLALLATLAPSAPAQATKSQPASKAEAPKAKSEAPTPGGDAAAPAEGDPEETNTPSPDQTPGGVDAATERKAEPVELFKDPRAEKALENQFPEVRKPTPPLQVSQVAGQGQDDVSRVQSMADQAAQMNSDLVKRYVTHFASELTSRANINAVLNPPRDPKNQGEIQRAARQAQAIGLAVDSLIRPIQIARARNNTSFLNAYNAEILRQLSPLVDNHLLARIQAMIVIGTTGSQDAVDLYINQLKNRDQVVWVKHWAAVGLSNTTQNGRSPLTNLNKALDAGRALADLLEEETDTPWPTRVRVLEAIGSLRQASMPLENRARIARVVAEELADAENRPAVRASAAWALGMIQVPAAVQGYNYPLIGYLVGTATADIGEEIVRIHSENPEQSRTLTSLILYRILPAFEGEQGVRESGFLRVQGQSFDKLFAPIRGVAAAATQLSQAPRALAAQRRDELAARVSDLRAYLEKNKPQSASLVPGTDPLVDPSMIATGQAANR